MHNQLCITSCVFWFCNYIDEEERAGCFDLIVFPMSCGYSVWLKEIAHCL